MAEVSIVVPIYNAEKHLERCITSILNQSESDIEVILVDDGSLDNSYDICNRFQNRDSRVHVIRKKNGGPHSARKAGVNSATSPYISFVDADDWIDEGLISNLLKNIQQNNADLVVFGYSYDENKKSTICLNSISTGVYHGSELRTEVWCKMLCEGNSISTKLIPSMCAKLFKTEKLIPIVNELDDSISMGEDLCSSFSYVLQSNRVVVDNNNWGYHYCSQEQSITKIHDELYLDKFIKTCKYLDSMLYKLDVEYLENNFNRYKVYLIYRELGVCVNNGEKNKIKWIIDIFMPFLNKPDIKKIFEKLDINALNIFWIPRKLLLHLCKQNKRRVKYYYYLWLSTTSVRLKIEEIMNKKGRG